MVARLGRYEVLKHLASGGMADVLLGRTGGIEGFERHVVLKRIKPVHVQGLRFIRMFLGFILGARAARNQFDLQQKREAEREAARAARAARRAAGSDKPSTSS